MLDLVDALVDSFDCLLIKSLHQFIMTRHAFGRRAVGGLAFGRLAFEGLAVEKESGSFEISFICRFDENLEQGLEGRDVQSVAAAIVFGHALYDDAVVLGLRVLD